MFHCCKWQQSLLVAAMWSSLALESTKADVLVQPEKPEVLPRQARKRVAFSSPPSVVGGKGRNSSVACVNCVQGKGREMVETYRKVL